MSVFLQRIGLLEQAALSSYVGPGDIISGATAYFGVRAYSGAYAAVTGNAFDLRRDSDNGTMTATFLTTGALDTATITTWAGGANVFATRAYDQSGNGRDINSSATLSLQPQLFLSGGPGGFPYLQRNSTGGATTGPNFAPSTGVASLVAVGNRSAGTGTSRLISENGQSGNRLGAAGANTWALTQGIVVGSAAISATANDATWHDAIGVINGASSVLSIDGSDTTGSITGATNSSNVWMLEAGTSSTLQMVEAGFWDNVALSGGQRTSLRSNIRTYYGF